MMEHECKAMGPVCPVCFETNRCTSLISLARKQHGLKTKRRAHGRTWVRREARWELAAEPSAGTMELAINTVLVLVSMAVFGVMMSVVVMFTGSCTVVLVFSTCYTH